MNISADAQDQRFNWLQPVVHIYSILWAAALTVLLLARSEAWAALPFVLSGLPVFAVLLFLNRPRIRSAFRKPAHLALKIILNILYVLISAAFLLNWMVPSDRLPATGSISHVPLVGLYLVLIFIDYRFLHPNENTERHSFFRSLSGRNRFLQWLFVPIFLVYLSNDSLLLSGDSRGSALLPITLFTEGDFDLDEFFGDWRKQNEYFAHLEERQRKEAAVVSRTITLPDGTQRELHHIQLMTYIDGHFYPAFPVFPAVFSIPTYVLLRGSGLITENIIPPEFAALHSTDARLERITAAWLAALTVLLFYLIVRRRLPALWSLLLSLVYALATFHYTVSAQGLWQHGPAEFFILAAILAGDASIQRKKASLAFWCSLALACVFFTRPQNFFITGVLGLYYFWQLRKVTHGWLWFIPGPILPGMLYLIVNLSVYHHPLGGYAHMIHLYYEGPAEAFSGDFWNGLGGLLVSPGRGLFLYCPVLLLSLVGIWRGRFKPAVWVYTFIVIFQIILYSNYLLWWGGLTYGPRFLMETIPFFMLLMAYAFKSTGSEEVSELDGSGVPGDSERSAIVAEPDRPFDVSPGIRQALLWLGLLSFVFQFAGIVNTAAFKRWNEFPHIDTFPDRVWDWSYPAFMAPLTPYRSLLEDATRFSLAYYPTQGRIVRDARGMHGYLVEVNTAVTARIITAGLPVYLKAGDHKLRLHARLEQNRKLNIPLHVGVALSRNQKELGRIHVDLQSTSDFTDTLLEIAVPEAGVYEISLIPDEYPGKLTVDYLEIQ